MGDKKSVSRNDIVFDEIIVSDYSVSFGLTWKDIIYIPFYRFSTYIFALIVYSSIIIAIFIITYQPYGKFYDEVLFHIVTILELVFLARTILAILHRILEEHRIRKVYPPEPIFLLIVDCITLLPVASYCFLINRFDWNHPIDYRIGYYYAFALKLPRVIRLYSMYHSFYNDLARNPRTIVLIIHGMMSILFIMMLSSLHYTIFYYSDNGPTWADRFKVLTRQNITYETPIVCFLFAGGFNYGDILTPMPYYSLSEMEVAAVALMISYICHIVYLNSHLIAVYVQLMRFKHFYEWRLLKVGTFTKLLRFDQPLQDAINTYYRTIWATRGGYVEIPDIVRLFPSELRTEIAMDLYFDAIRHSMIFSPLNETYKKELSRLFQTEIYIPGQLMFIKDKIKAKLIYLQSGIVEIMSIENRDSPVLSFSPGTILGEISCLLPYMCSADIRCSTTCVAHVLRHCDLKNLLARDSNLNSTMQRIINERIEYCRKKYLRVRRLDQPISHIYWIKYRWRKLNKRHTAKYPKALAPEPLTKYYCSKYMSLIVLSSYYELKVHSICVRGKCSFVMEQESSFRKFLDLFCTLGAVVHFVLTFHVIIFEGRITKDVFALLTLFDMLYLLDIYFQAITAVRVHNVFISKPMDILVYKCKQLRFLIDVFSSIPYDYFATLMGASPYYIGLCRLPKYMKLIKVVEFFTAYEHLLNVSPRTWKVTRDIVIHCLIILLCACFVYLWTCFNGICEADGWLETIKKQTRANFGRDIETTDFVISFIYTSSIYLQMKIHHFQATNVIEQVGQFLICVCGFYLINLTLSQWCGTIALENYPRFLYMYNLSFFNTVFQDRPELRRFRAKVNEYFSLQWFFASCMSFNDIASLMSHQSKFVRHKVTHEYMMVALRKTQAFSTMSDAFLELVCSYCKFYVIPVNHVLQRPDTSVPVLYIILDGWCKVQSFTPEDEEKNREFFYTQYDMFPVIGFFQAVNSFLYAETYTTVKILAIQYHNFMSCVKAIPVDGDILLGAIQDNLTSHQNLIMRIVHLPLLYYPEPHEKSSQVSIFDYKENAGKDDNKHLKWQRLNRGSIRNRIYSTFMRTFDPHGLYLYYEVFRGLLIFMEMIMLYTSLHRYIRVSNPFKVLKVVVLIFDLLDLYVRAHVHYFTPTGIRVTNLKSTFKYYFRHSFSIDLISMLPYERMHVFELFRDRSKSSLNIMICLILQPLKLYRPFFLLNFLRKTILIEYHNAILICTNTILIIIILAHLAAFALVKTCDIDDDWYWNCPTDSWLHLDANYSYWHDQNLLYSRTNYEVISSHVTRSSMYFTLHDYILFCFMGVFICMVRIWYQASIIGHNVFSTKYLVNFQERRRRYYTLASKMQIPKVLIDELIEHYKYMFKKTRTDEAKDILEPFYPHIQEAIQLAMFAPTLYQTKILEMEGSELHRFIAPFITEQYYIINATILRCNDINRNIFIVKKGFVEVSVADEAVAFLGPGGMFGCFKQKGINRSMITVTAKVHADLLVIDTSIFIKITKIFRNVKREMKCAHLTNCEYIESMMKPAKSSYTGEKINVFARCSLRNWFMYTFDDRNRFIVFFRYFTEMHLAPLVSIVALISMVVISSEGTSTYFWMMVDIYFLIDMYMICHIGVRDEESGLILARVQELTKAYLKSWKFYWDVLTLIPFYLFSKYIKDEYIGYLLANKSLRIMNMFVYYSTYMRTRYLPNHMRLSFLSYMLLFCLNALCFLICTTIFFLKGESLSPPEIAANYLQVANIFTTAGIDPPGVENFSKLFYITVAVFLTNILYVLINSGFAKLAVMIYYTDMEFRRAVITFKAYCQHEDVSKPIVNQCWYYLMHLYYKHGGEQFPSLILNSPNYILEAHMTFIAADLLYKHRVFKFAHRDFLRQMIRYMRYEFIMPGFTIAERGDKRKRMYFIAEGTVLSIDTTLKTSEYETLNWGASFGEAQALHGKQFETTYKALTPVQLFVISNHDWVYLLKWFPATAQILNECAL